MNRNLKTTGLTLVAVFAVSAMNVAGAQAEKVADFDAEAGTVKVDVEADGNQSFSIDGKIVVCAKITAHAAYSGVSAESKSTKVGYENCHTTAFGLGFPTTVTQDPGCLYTFTAGTYITANDDSTGSLDICGATIDIYSNHEMHTLGIDRCQIHVPAQTINGITYTNTITPAENSKMAVTVDVTNVSVTSTTTDTNTLGCNDHVHGTATYNSHIWLKGTNAAAEYTDLTIKGT